MAAAETLDEELAVAKAESSEFAFIVVVMQCENTVSQSGLHIRVS